MADVITRFKLETTQYDSKLRDAAKGISDVAHQAELAGQGFNNFSQKSIEAARALGQTASGATNAKDKVRDLVGAYNEAAKAYNKLTQEQQQSDFGKALAQSLTQLKDRITEAKQELYSVGDSTKSTGSIMDQLAGKLAVNIDAFKLLNVGVSAAKGALDVAKSAFMANEAAVDEWGRTMQSAQGLYEGFLNALNTGDISGYLSRMDEIMRAARAAYDELDKLGTMKTIQAPKISAQQTENERMRMMIQTGRYIAPIDGRKASMQNGQLLTPEQIKRIETQLQNGLKTVTSLVGNEVKQSGKAIDAYYNSLAKQNGMSLQEFRKGTSSWEEFSKKLAGFDAYKEWDKNARTEFARQGGRGNVDFDKNNPYADFKKWGVFRVDKQGENSLNDLVKLIQQRDQQTSQAYSTLSQSYRAINRAEGVTVSKLMGRSGSGGGTNPQEQAAKQVAEAQRVYAETIAKADMELKSGLATDADVKKKTLAAQEQLYSAYGKAYATYADPKYKEAQDKAAAEIVKLGGEVKTSVDAQKKMQEAARELERAQKKLADAQAKLADAQKTGDLKQVYTAQKAVTNAQKEVTTAQTNVERVRKETTEVVNVEPGKVELPDVPKAVTQIVSTKVGEVITPDIANELTQVVNVEPGKVELPDVPKAVTVPITYTSGNLDAFISNLKEQISQADIGSELHNKLTAQLADATTLGTLMQTAIQNGIDTTQFNPQDLWKKVFGDNPGDYIENADWQSIVENINKKLKEMKLDPIKINFETGNVAKDGKEVAKDWNNAASAISSVGSAMSQIEDPAAKVMGTIAQAIATIALTYAKSLEGTFTPWDWIAGAAAGLAQMTAVISAIHSSTGYAEGGVVKGNSYSGDNLMAQGPNGQLIGLNAGEVVLNRAQSANLASQLQGSGGQTVHVVGKLSGESLFLCAENWAKRTGKGEFVTWR